MAEGGSAATFGTLQQNIAQEGRQNNACAATAATAAADDEWTRTGPIEAERVVKGEPDGLEVRCKSAGACHPDTL
ncbi:hypothetical protein GCM10010510_72090 [Streptomyces anandii JCM 4720]|nr:hypothetical protein GCM10010510_72090 [Streptomyces anandii JCM 4720]